jgi:hypothetical protein
VWHGRNAPGLGPLGSGATIRPSRGFAFLGLQALSRGPIWDLFSSSEGEDQAHLAV